MSRMVGMLLVMALAGQAWAYQANATVRCTVDGEQGIVKADLIVTGAVSAEHQGVPGLVYLALRDLGVDRAQFYDIYGQWWEYQGGLFPVAVVARTGLGNVSFTADVTPYVKDGNYAVYIGYGMLTPAIETKVAQYRATVDRAKQTPNGAKIRDPGDDHVRRTLIQDEMTKAGRYGPILSRLAC